MQEIHAHIHTHHIHTYKNNIHIKTKNTHTHIYKKCYKIYYIIIYIIKIYYLRLWRYINHSSKTVIENVQLKKNKKNYCLAFNLCISKYIIYLYGNS